MKQKNTIGNLNKTKDLIDNGRRDWKWVSGENRCVTAKICRALLLNLGIIGWKDLLFYLRRTKVAINFKRESPPAPVDLRMEF